MLTKMGHNTEENQALAVVLISIDGSATITGPKDFKHSVGIAIAPGIIERMASVRTRSNARRF